MTWQAVRCWFGFHTWPDWTMPQQRVRQAKCCKQWELRQFNFGGK